MANTGRMNQIKDKKGSTAKLPAARGEQSNLESIVIGAAISRDYHKHSVLLLGFRRRMTVPASQTPVSEYGNVCWDLADFDFFDGKASARGEKLLTALTRLAAETTSHVVMPTSRVWHVLRNWATRGPRQRRLMPELLMWVLACHELAPSTRCFFTCVQPQLGGSLCPPRRSSLQL